MQGDMVVEAGFPSPVILRNSGFGVQVQADVRETEKDREIASRHFYNQFAIDEDIAKIRDPVIEMDRGRTLEFNQFYSRVFEGFFPWRHAGAPASGLLPGTTSFSGWARTPSCSGSRTGRLSCMR